MANGELISQVDDLLRMDTISPKVATTLSLKLLKGIYETQQEHSNRLTTLETANQVEAVGRHELINWSWVRDKIVQPGVILFLGWFFFSFLPDILRGG